MKSTQGVAARQTQPHAQRMKRQKESPSQHAHLSRMPTWRMSTAMMGPPSAASERTRSK